VIALGTSAASAAILGEELGVTAQNLHKFLWEYTRGPAAQALRSGAAVRPDRAGFQVRAGDVILLDEAGMAGTLNLDRLVQIAAERGASVRLLGDHRQLGAVESGGALRLLVNESAPPNSPACTASATR
jgi:ATP-dependent exoDNAse (exonuclease V) alpha subunit